MLFTTLIMAAIASALVFLGYRQGNGAHLVGLADAARNAGRILPLMFFAFIVAGMMKALVPQSVISTWLGAEAGWKGLLIAAAVGSLTPGGPAVSFPIAVGLSGAGASVGASVAYLTGWAVWGVNRLPLEFGILGWKLTLIRFVSTMFFPPLAGWFAQTFFGRVRI